MENSAYFPFDPNATQTGIRSGKHRKVKNRRLPELFRQAAQSFFRSILRKSYSLFNAVQILIHPLRSLSYPAAAEELLPPVPAVFQGADGSEEQSNLAAGYGVSKRQPPVFKSNPRGRE